MPEILQLGVTIQCPHGGMGSVVNTNTKVKAEETLPCSLPTPIRLPVCPFTIGPSPHPCVTIQWTAPAQRVKVDGQPVLLSTSVGLCKAADHRRHGNLCSHVFRHPARHHDIPCPPCRPPGASPQSPPRPRRAGQECGCCHRRGMIARFQSCLRPTMLDFLRDLLACCDYDCAIRAYPKVRACVGQPAKARTAGRCRVFV